MASGGEIEDGESAEGECEIEGSGDGVEGGEIYFRDGVGTATGEGAARARVGEEVAFVVGAAVAEQVRGARKCGEFDGVAVRMPKAEDSAHGWIMREEGTEAHRHGGTNVSNSEPTPRGVA